MPEQTKETLPESTEGSKSPKGAGDTTSVSIEKAAAEIDRILGSSRAAADEIERLRQSTSTTATDAELARTKAHEHLKEIGSSCDAAKNEVATIKASVTSIAAKAKIIDENASAADESRKVIGTIETDVAELRSKVEQASNGSGELSVKIKTLLEQLENKRIELAPLSEEVTSLLAAAKDAASVSTRARDEIVLLRNTTAKNAEDSAANCRHIDNGKAYVDAQRAEAESYVAGAKGKLDEMTTAHSDASEVVNQIEGLQRDAQGIRDSVKAAVEAVQLAREGADINGKKIAELAQLADSVSARVTTYEDKLKSFEEQFAKLNNSVNELLPGATSAGLAAAYHAQQLKYVLPRRLWTIAFFVAIAGFAAVGICEIVEYWGVAAPDYQQLVRLVLVRWPLLVALLWLALYAANKARLASQIQETYVHKEVLSRSFEGYRREFKAVGTDDGAASPAGALCTAIVTVLSENPSRVYDKHAADPTPMSSIAESAEKLASAVKDIKAIPLLKK